MNLQDTLAGYYKAIQALHQFAVDMKDIDIPLRDPEPGEIIDMDIHASPSRNGFPPYITLRIWYKNYNSNLPLPDTEDLLRTVERKFEVSLEEQDSPKELVARREMDGYNLIIAVVTGDLIWQEV